MATQGKVSISAGRWKRHTLQFPVLPGVRPALSRTRETIFDWLMHEVRGAKCLDLFAGSGALGIEALSRGAQQVTFVDIKPALVQALRSNLVRLGVPEACYEILLADYQAALQRLAANRYDLVFLDPPYKTLSLAKVLDVLLTEGCLQSGTLVVYEAAILDFDKNGVSFERLKAKRLGQGGFGLLRVK